MNGVNRIVARYTVITGSKNLKIKKNERFMNIWLQTRGSHEVNSVQRERKTKTKIQSYMMQGMTKYVRATTNWIVKNQIERKRRKKTIESKCLGRETATEEKEK